MADVSLPLIVVDASYGGINAKTAIQNIQGWKDFRPATLSYVSGNLNNIVGADPMPNWVKTVCILYSYFPDKPQLFVATERSGDINFTRYDNANAQSLPRVSGSNPNFKILALVYGNKIITDQSIYDSVYASLAAGKAYVCDNNTMKGDPQPNIRKSATLFFQTANGQVRSASCQEGGTINV